MALRCSGCGAPINAALIDVEWPSGQGREGVHTHEGNLLWWYRPGGPNGRFGEAAASQTWDDYARNGPRVSCPAHVEADLDRQIGHRCTLEA